MRGGGHHMELTPEAQALLAAQPWRGNIRELRNVLEQLALRSDSPQIEASELRAVLEAGGQVPLPALAVRPGAGLASASAALAAIRPLAERVAELEHSAIAEALVHTAGNRTAAARLLGISRASLYDRLEAMGELSEKQANV
jgi:DNA-binding NtrC family response regulator